MFHSGFGYLTEKKLFLMKKYVLSVLIVFMASLIFTSCGSTKILRQPHDPEASLLFLSAAGVYRQFAGLEFKGFEMKLENVETHEQYESRFFKSSPYGSANIVFLIPPGVYKVVSVGCVLEASPYGYGPYGDVGRPQIFQSYHYVDDPIQLLDFWGAIVVKPNSAYYLGTYSCFDNDLRLKSVALQCHIQYERPNNNEVKSYMPKEIRRALSKSTWKNIYFIHPAMKINSISLKPVSIDD